MNIENLDDFDFENQKPMWDFKSLKESGVDFWTRLFLRIAPRRGIERLSRKMGVDPDMAARAHALFANAQKVDVIPFESGEGGFKFILNRSTALYFYQDGDHFVYDGWETGEYEKGEVTIFDHLK